MVYRENIVGVSLVTYRVLWMNVVMCRIVFYKESLPNRNTKNPVLILFFWYEMNFWFLTLICFLLSVIAKSIRTTVIQQIWIALGWHIHQVPVLQWNMFHLKAFQITTGNKFNKTASCQNCELCRRNNLHCFL